MLAESKICKLAYLAFARMPGGQQEQLASFHTNMKMVSQLESQMKLFSILKHVAKLLLMDLISQ